jgi:hypothetical protein
MSIFYAFPHPMDEVAFGGRGGRSSRRKSRSRSKPRTFDTRSSTGVAQRNPNSKAANCAAAMGASAVAANSPVPKARAAGYAGATAATYFCTK